MWHSLDRNGKTKYYDILWESGNIESNVLINELEAVKVKEHSHTSESEKKPIKERRYKGK